MGGHELGIGQSTGDEVHCGQIAPNCISDISPLFQIRDADSSDREVDSLFTLFADCKDLLL